MIVSKDHANVLVVDNNPVLLKTISSLLVKEGCTVRTAENGLEALDVLRVWHVDIVFTDLVMPLVEGSVLCNIIRNKKEYKHIFVVVLSAIVEENREQIELDIPCDACFAKSTILEMKQQVQDVLECFFSGTTQRDMANGGSEKSLDSYVQSMSEVEGKGSSITKELLIEKDHLRNILEDLSEGIIELNQNGKIVRINSATEHIFLKRQENLIGLSLNNALEWNQYGNDIEEWLQKDLLQTGMKPFFIQESDPLSVGDRMVTANFKVIDGADAAFAICIFHDITRQFLAEKHKKQVDTAMELMKKMEAMRGMAGGVAHDFNNLLTVICGNLDIILASQKSERPDEEQMLIENARKASLIAVDLTRTISCFSNFGIVHRVDSEINTLIESGVQKFFRDNDFPHELQLSAQQSRVQVDPSEIEIVLANVLENSIESQEGHEQLITISSKKISWEEPQLLAGQYLPAGTYARVDIKDRGPGIKGQFISRIFDAYYSTKERSSVKGMGLGLAVVYSVMRNHGGYAVVESEYGTGTTVSLFFPVYSNNAVIDESAKKKKDKLILFIESDSQLQELGRIMLEYLGFEVVNVASGDEALIYLDKIRDNDKLKRPSVVLLEMSTLEEETVAHLCGVIQKTLPAVEIIGISGTPLDPVIENCRKHGISNTLTKPYTLDCLKHVLETAGTVR